MRGTAPRARAEFVERMHALENATLRTGVTVQSIEGEQTVNAVEVRSGSGGTERIECAGVFVFAGLEPNSEVAPPAVVRDAAGAIETDASMQTAVPGIYAAGAVRAGYSGRLVDAVREAKEAAESAARRLRA